MPQQLRLLVQLQDQNNRFTLASGEYYSKKRLNVLHVVLPNGSVTNFLKDPKTQVWSNVTYMLTARVIGTN